MGEADALWEAFLADERDRLPLLALADWHEERGEENSAYWVRWLAESVKRPAGSGLWQIERPPANRRGADGIITEHPEELPAGLFFALPGVRTLIVNGVRQVYPGFTWNHYASRRDAWDALRAAMSQCSSRASG